MVNDHLTRLAVLVNRTAPLNVYVSNNILTMINQVRAVRAYINESWQECLNELNTGVQRERQYPPDVSSPSLTFSRSSELLATHLLLMHERFQQQKVSPFSITSIGMRAILSVGPSTSVQLLLE